MTLNFSNEQVQVLYELIGKSQITGNGAKMIATLQTVIEKAVEEDKKSKFEDQKE